MFRKIYNTIKPSSAVAVMVAFAAAVIAPLSADFSAIALGLSGSVGGFSFSLGSGSGGGGIGEALCTVVSWITDEGIGQAVASLAVIFLGIQAFFGKVNWGTAVMFAAGIFAIFGSQEIVDAITGGLSGGGGC